MLQKQFNGPAGRGASPQQSFEFFCGMLLPSCNRHCLSIRSVLQRDAWWSQNIVSFASIVSQHFSYGLCIRLPRFLLTSRTHFNWIMCLIGAEVLAFPDIYEIVAMSPCFSFRAPLCWIAPTKGWAPLDAQHSTPWPDTWPQNKSIYICVYIYVRLTLGGSILEWYICTAESVHWAGPSWAYNKKERTPRITPKKQRTYVSHDMYSDEYLQQSSS